MPGVAETWKQKDPTTWVFNLRKNAKWSDGTPVTADDFVYGWQRFLDPKTASPYASTYGTFVLNGLEVATVGGAARKKTPLQTASGSTSIDQRRMADVRYWCNSMPNCGNRRCKAARLVLSISICARSRLAMRCGTIGTAG